MCKHRSLGIFIDLEGLTLSEDEILMLNEPRVAGVILFSRNYQSPEQLKALTDGIKAQRSDLIISADQEGGRVQRFKQGFTRLPPMFALFEQYQKNQTQALENAQSLGWLMAYELLEQGVDLSFAPVLDVERGISSVIGDRSFASEPQTVVELASAFCVGMQEAGMVCVGKHFPGHGGIEADTHLQAAIDERTLDELDSCDLIPFKTLIENQHLSGIMPAHVRYPKVDTHHNAGFSEIWLQQILRQKLQFNGVIFSDDLSMQAAANVGGSVERAKAAISSGCNVLLLCNQPQALKEVLEYLKTLPQYSQSAQTGHSCLDLSAWKTSFKANVKRHIQAKQQLAGWFNPER